MSTLTLDRSDEAVDQMVSAWKNGGNYQVSLRIQQIGSDPKMATFHVAEVTNETEGEAMPEHEMPEHGTNGKAAMPAPASKPAVQVKY